MIIIIKSRKKKDDKERRREESRRIDFARLDVVAIDRFFRLNVSFPNDVLREICAFVLSCIMRTYGREQDEILKETVL